VAGKTKRNVPGIALFHDAFLGEGDALADGSLLIIPPVDLYETRDSYVLSAELPGVEAGDVRVEVSGTDLIISGERKLTSCCPDENYHRLEGMRGRFHRTFALPVAVAEDAEIKATLQDGVLQVVLTKPADSSRIPIKGASRTDARQT